MNYRALLERPPASDAMATPSPSGMPVESAHADHEQAFVGSPRTPAAPLVNGNDIAPYVRVMCHGQSLSKIAPVGSHAIRPRYH